MRYFNLRLLLVALSAAIFFAAISINSGAAEEPAPTSPEATESAPQAPKPLRNHCGRLFTQKQFRRYARKVYLRRSVEVRAALRMKQMVRCQHSAKAERKMREARNALKKRRIMRLTMYCGTTSCNRNLGRYMAARRGWGASQFSCLDELWGARESGWNQYADNPSSDAYGIPQALPGSKMGPGWQSSPYVQIRWGLGYIAGRFGTPCGALAHSHANGWY
jgi:hypothetical protein